MWCLLVLILIDPDINMLFHFFKLKNNIPQIQSIILFFFFYHRFTEIDNFTENSWSLLATWTMPNAPELWIVKVVQWHLFYNTCCWNNCNVLYIIRTSYLKFSKNIIKIKIPKLLWTRFNTSRLRSKTFSGLAYVFRYNYVYRFYTIQLEKCKNFIFVDGRLSQNMYTL